MMLSEWLAQLLNEDDRRVVDNCFQAFAAEKPERTALINAANSVSELEKQYVPQNAHQLVDQELMGRVLVCTVGLRPMPVILTTLIIKPTRLYLLHTTESRRIAESIRDDPYVQQLGLDPVNDIVLRTISLTDAPQNYEHLRNIVREHPQDNLVVDISGGVKVMGTSLAAAAFWLRIPVVYQLGEEVQGIVHPFSERLIQLENPFAFFGATELRSIERLFSYGDYDGALSLTQSLRESVGDLNTLGRLNILQEFIEVYRDWDAFQHSIFEDKPERKLAGRLRAVHGKCQRMHLTFAKDLQSVHRNIVFLQEIENLWQTQQRNLTDRYRLVDIYVSAQRRAKGGKYDDAVGRLYRCLEMAATLCLQEEYAIGDPRNPDLSNLAQHLGGEDKLAEAFTKSARYSFPKGRSLGLKDQMVLLGLNSKSRYSQIAGIYRGMEGSGLIEKRNRSILAHGTVAVSQEEYKAFEHKTREILDRTVGEKGEFDRLLHLATHPEIQVEL